MNPIITGLHNFGLFKMNRLTVIYNEFGIIVNIISELC
jgi:hypothetical protein